jgi:hypothetical protein
VELTELTGLVIRAVASDTVLARVVVLIAGAGGRVRELRWEVEPSGSGCVHCLVETAPGRGGRVAAALSRVVDVLSVEVAEDRARLATVHMAGPEVFVPAAEVPGSPGLVAS